MKIEFYEEFPNKKNLKKLKLVKFSTKIFLAAKSVKEFKKYEKIANSYKKDLEVAYWPILKNSYWISPFSNKKDLIELFSELEKIKNSLLLDLELPLKSKWKMYLKNIFFFRQNKKLIYDFLKRNKSRITTAEYGYISNKTKKIIGLNYNVDCEKSIMFYTSMFSEKMKEKIKNKILKIEKKSNYSISLGTIAIGILGDEPILLTENLERDLKFVKKSGFKKVVIFRLGGLNKNYLNILNKFI